MHEGSTNPRLKQELRSATDLARSRSTVPREGDVHICGPRAPSMAQPCWEERSRQSELSRRSRLPGLTVRRHCRGLCPAVLGSTEADRGNTSCPGVMHRSAAEQDPVCLSPWAPSCVLQSCSAPCWIVGRRVEPLAGARRPLCSSWPRYRPERR